MAGKAGLVLDRYGTDGFSQQFDVGVHRARTIRTANLDNEDMKVVRCRHDAPYEADCIWHACIITYAQFSRTVCTVYVQIEALGLYFLPEGFWPGLHSSPGTRTLFEPGLHRGRLLFKQYSTHIYTGHYRMLYWNLCTPSLNNCFFCVLPFALLSLLGATYSSL